MFCTVCIISAWSSLSCSVERGTDIPFDLESTPLQIKTNSATGSEEKIRVVTYMSDGKFLGGVKVKFSYPMEYAIAYCTGWITFPTQPPDKVDKIWTIRKTATTLNIEGNGVEVLDYHFSDSSKSECVPRWGGDVVGKIMFLSNDAASKNYRAMPTGNK